MLLYKLTNEHDRTYGETQWGDGVSHETNGAGNLCGSGWIHAYTSPLLAIFLNPIHGNYDLKTAHLWEAGGEIEKDDFGLKVGCTRLTTTQRIPLPVVTTHQRVKFAILCTLKVYDAPAFVEWAKNWWEGTDRTAKAARAVAREAAVAARAPHSVARAAEWAAEWDEEWNAAWEEAWATRAAEAAAWAARAAARAAQEAARAAVVAEWSIWMAAAINVMKRLDLIALAQEAVG